MVPGGLPSQLLARRPDIIAAEYRVLSAYNIVGQARLAQLPSISLTARGGTASFALSDLLKSFTFGFMPSINLPMLDPNVRARVKTTEANIGVVENEYGRTVMTAFEEVESALVNVDAHKRQRIELQQQVDQLRVVSTQIEAQAEGRHRVAAGSLRDRAVAAPGAARVVGGPPTNPGRYRHAVQGTRWRLAKHHRQQCRAIQRREYDSERSALAARARTKRFNLETRLPRAFAQRCTAAD